MGKIYWLNISYDEHTDEFFAYVDDGVKSGKSVFQIDSTEEVCDYIKTGRMKHIDDVDGLTKFLIEQDFIKNGDMIKLNKVLLW